MAAPGVVGRRRAAVVGPFRVLRHRNYALVAAGNLANSLGMWARLVGVGWAAQDLTDSPALLGVAVGAQFLPSLFLAPFGGLVADRFDRRLVNIVGNLAMAVPTLAIALLLHGGTLTIWGLIGLAMAGGAMQSFTQPAMTAVIPRLVPVDEVRSAVALNSVITNGSRFVGSALIGWVIAAFGTEAAFEFNTVAFLVVVAAWLAVRLPPAGDHGPAPAVETFRQRLGGGLRFVRGQQAVRTLLLLNVAAGMLIVQQHLLPLVASEVLDAGASAYGLLNSATGLGSIVGAFVAGSVSTDRGRRRAIVTALPALGATVLAISLSRSVLLSVLLQAVYGYTFFVILTISMTVITLSTPDRVRGRVMALHTMTLTGISPVSALTAGVVASWVGTSTTILLAGALLLAYAVWFVLRRAQVVELVMADDDGRGAAAGPPAAGPEAAGPEVAPTPSLR